VRVPGFLSLLALVLLSAAAGATQPTVSASGKVVDETGRPVQGARVELLVPGFGDRADPSRVSPAPRQSPGQLEAGPTLRRTTEHGSGPDPRKFSTRTVAARQQWMKSLAPSLDRALDRQLARRGIPAPVPGRSAAWLQTALDRGLRPAHALQALARVGVPLAENLRATSHALAFTRAVVSHSVKTAALLTARALGVPTLPLRLASLSWSLARDLVHVLSR
jgi:hypothetical protein